MVSTKNNYQRLMSEKSKPTHDHEWSDWKEIGRTGDWFKPIIVERKCKKCGCSETDEH